MKIIETLVVLGLAGSFVLLVATGFNLVSSHLSKFGQKSSVDENVAQFTELLFQVGSHALACEVERDPLLAGTLITPGSAIHCDVRGQDGTTTRFRFTYNTLASEIWVYRGTASEPVMKFSNISEFRVCDDKSMGYLNGTDPDLADRCLLDSCDSWSEKNYLNQAVAYCRDDTRAMSALHVSNLKGELGPPLRTRPERFFRFRIKGAFKSEVGQPPPQASTFQSAFHVRNPTPKSLGFSTYLWK